MDMIEGIKINPSAHSVLYILVLYEGKAVSCSLFIIEKSLLNFLLSVVHFL